ncbi:MAG: YicC family protein [Polaribacter sp.]|nr:YicC family protein [Polaribacter sp.]
MLQSMTGYGKVNVQLASKKITLEIKSLNSKSLDLNLRMPSFYKEKEIDVRKSISEKLQRGKIDFFITLENSQEQTSTIINSTIVKNYMQQLRTIIDNSELDVEFLKIAVKMPDALTAEKEGLNSDEWVLIEDGLKRVIENITQFRIDEGKTLHKDLSTRVVNIQNYLIDIEQVDKERLQEIRTRLDKTFQDIKQQVDANRFEQEVLYYLEKLDVNEEKVRLKSHLDYFLKTINTSESQGKKLGFIAQEMGREINTLGSKANFAPMQKIVILMKNELEQIKEQLLNVL